VAVSALHLASGGEINMAVRAIKWPGRANVFVSLVAIHKGTWPGPRFLDGKSVQFISAHLDEMEASAPVALTENVSTMLEGSKNRGEGFFITHLEARRLIADDTRNADVVIPILSGGEITDVPDQAPQRCAIFFWNWDISRASEYRLPFSLLQQRVGEERSANPDAKLSGGGLLGLGFMARRRRRLTLIGESGKNLIRTKWDGRFEPADVGSPAAVA
jgi:hypothetical protein